MSYLLDTNILIAYLRDDEDVVRELTTWKSENAVLFLSVITEIELLSLPNLTEQEIKIIRNFIREFTVVPLDSNLAFIASEIRRKTNLKIADAIVTGTSRITQSILVTRDKEILSKASAYVRCVSIS